MKRVAQGFTLIELMIVVAVIGILASIALPAYQDYAIRAKLSEVILAMSVCRTQVTELYQQGGSAPGANNWGCETGVASRYVASLETDADGKVSARVDGINSTLNDKIVTMMPLAGLDTPAGVGVNFGNGLFGWRCGAVADGTDLPPQYLPASCRSA
jgi:type IV pilus assembly protein PilA